MTPDTEQFENVRRLLALKRHEQPPPGYFDQFSSNVIIRIREGERGEDADWLSSLFGEAPWLHRFWTVLEARPILTGSLGAVASALLVAGVVFSERPEMAAASQDHAGMDVVAALAAQPVTGPYLDRTEAAAFGSTNGFLVSGRRDAAFFDAPVQNVSFVVPSNK